MYAKLSYIESYINTLHNIFTKSAETQSNIHYSYNQVTEVWVDWVSQQAGNHLNNIGAILIRANEELYRMFDRLNQSFSVLSDGYLERPWNATFKDRYEFETKLRLDRIMETDVINGTTIEAIEQFESALIDYIEATEARVNQVQNAHQEVSAWWQDEQRHRVSEIIDGFSEQMKKQLDQLRNVVDWIDIRKNKFIEFLKLEADALRNG